MNHSPKDLQTKVNTDYQNFSQDPTIERVLKSKVGNGVRKSLVVETNILSTLTIFKVETREETFTYDDLIDAIIKYHSI